MSSSKWTWPTRKWLVATLLAIGTVATLWAEAGSFTKPVEIALIALIIQRLVAYIVPNGEETTPPGPGGGGGNVQAAVPEEALG